MVTAWRSPTNTGTSVSVGTPDEAWIASDDVYAVFNAVNDQAVYTALGSFGIPSNAIIEGIEVGVECKTSNQSSPNNTASFAIFNGSYRTKNLTPQNTEQEIILGGATDLWGGAWTPTNFNDDTFKVRISYSGLSVTHSFDYIRVRVYYSLGQTHTTDAYIKKLNNTKTHTTDALLKKSATKSHTTDAYLLEQVGQPTWVSPSNHATQIDATEPLVATMPNAIQDMHFELQIDSANTFDTGDLQTFNSFLDQTGWEYYDGADWQPVPQSGVPVEYVGNQVRFTPSSLAEGTWYRRIRGLLIISS